MLAFDGYNSCSSFKTMASLKQQTLSHQLEMILGWASCIALGKTAGKNSGCIRGEEHKHDLLVQGTGHLAGKEVAWLLLSAPRAVSYLILSLVALQRDSWEQGQDLRFLLPTDF